MSARAEVLVLGGYGGFGRRIVAALVGMVAASGGPVRIGVVGRDPAAAVALCSELGSPALVPLALDAQSAAGQRALLACEPIIMIDTVGPFQGTDRVLARACAERGVHYIDLADDAAAVTEIVALDALARERGALLVSGASTVPALSGAVIDALTGDLETVECIEIGIAPGYDGPRGLATIRSILSYIGRPIPQWQDGEWRSAPGWSGAMRHRYPSPVGERWLSRVDVPDASLWPRRYAGLRNLEVRAGLEVPLTHHGLGWIARLVSRGWLKDVSAHALLARRVAALLNPWGSDCGAMHVRVAGREPSGARRQWLWTVVATDGAGPEIPATAATLLASRLLGLQPDSPPLTQRGAMPAVGLLMLGEFESAWRGKSLQTSIVEEAAALLG